MKVLFVPFIFLFAFLLDSCSSAEADESNDTEEIRNIILDVKPLLNKSAEEVKSILGSIDRRETHTGYPCEDSSCEKVFYNDEKYEILFKNGKVDRLTINSTPNLSDDKDAILTLGFDRVKPSFQNAGTVVRYNDVDGIHEINFNYDFIYIVVNPTD